MKSIVRIVSLVLVGALVVVGGLLAFGGLPIPGNISAKVVQSGSMEPAILVGSLIVIKPSAPYEAGDVVTFGKDTKTEIPTTHRVVSVEEVNGENLYTVKGDANEEADPQKVPEKTVIGKVMFSVPYAGYLLDFARKPLGFTLLVVVPAGALILDEGVNIFNELMKIRRRKKEEANDTQNNVPS